MGRPQPALRTTASITTAAVLLTGAALGAAPAAGAAPATAPASAASAPGLTFDDIPGSGGITPQGQCRQHPPERRPATKHPAHRASRPAGPCRRSSTSPRPRSSPTPATSWSVTTSAASGSPAGRSRWRVHRTSPTPPRSSTGRWPTPRPTRTRSAWRGQSYGAGISLLAAAHDKRIKAVAALSGWADLIDSIYSGRTQHLQAAALLGGAGLITGRPSDELQQILKDFLASNLAKEPEMIAWGNKRSPATYLDQDQRQRRRHHDGQRLGRHDLPAQPVRHVLREAHRPQAAGVPPRRPRHRRG